MRFPLEPTPQKASPSPRTETKRKKDNLDPNKGEIARGEERRSEAEEEEGEAKGREV